MKKVFVFVIAIAMIFTIAACKAKAPAVEETPAAEPETPVEEPTAEPDTPVEEPAAEESETPAPEGDPADMTLEEIMSAIMNGVEAPMVDNIVLDEETVPYYAFISMPEGGEALASEAMINAIAHSAVLVRVADASEAEEVAAEIEKNADPAKWICVEAEKTIVSVHEDTILLVMSGAETAQSIAANFDALYA